MSEFNPEELKYYLLIFGVILMILIAYRRAVKKVQGKRDPGQLAKSAKRANPPSQVQETRLTEEQFRRSWKGLSYLLLLAGVGNLYMAYTALTKALGPSSLWVYWVDVISSAAAACFAVLIFWRKSKTWVFAYFIATLIPTFLFLSIKGQEFKLSALIHLFPLVLLYFVLKPTWNNLEVS